ncbi:hypothetical protein IF1G_02463 [Cordyceps javanica]|uniref:Uncharacterized protein n=1 Tax=Cordyceps javanica TaxID=43265 RepID=A0A545V9I7_9HYPO|nr:hypothetical protein IF1G_02463 [Cordyceps javanica]
MNMWPGTPKYACSTTTGTRVLLPLLQTRACLAVRKPQFLRTQDETLGVSYMDKENGHDPRMHEPSAVLLHVCMYERHPAFAAAKDGLSAQREGYDGNIQCAVRVPDSSFFSVRTAMGIAQAGSPLCTLSTLTKAEKKKSRRTPARVASSPMTFLQPWVQRVSTENGTNPAHHVWVARSENLPRCFGRHVSLVVGSMARRDSLFSHHTPPVAESGTV